MGGSNPGRLRGVKANGRGRVAVWLAIVTLAVSVIACAKRPVRPRARTTSRPQAAARIVGGDRGWGYLKTKLVADGVPRANVDSAFGDPIMPEFDGLTFSPYPPREGKTMYRDF